MQHFGNDDSGFSLELRGRLVVIRAWGFWDATLASQFTPASLKLCRQAGPPLRLLFDGAALKPQREEGQEAFRNLVAAVEGMGLVRAAVVVRNSITRMQLMRITKDSAAGRWVFIGAQEEAAFPELNSVNEGNGK